MLRRATKPTFLFLTVLHLNIYHFIRYTKGVRILKCCECSPCMVGIHNGGHTYGAFERYEEKEGRGRPPKRFKKGPPTYWTKEVLSLMLLRRG